MLPGGGGIHITEETSVGGLLLESNISEGRIAITDDCGWMTAKPLTEHSGLIVSKLSGKI